MSISYKKWLFICALSTLLISFFHVFISEKINFVIYSDGYFQITDYAYHIIIVKAFWFEGFGDIYDLFFQQQALSTHVGSPIKTVMPLGVTPIALIVWLPFGYAARFNMALSYTLWTIFSIGILSSALWHVWRYVFQRGNIQILPIALSLCTLFSVTSKSAIFHGQTSILATGSLIFLIYIVHNLNGKPQGSYGFVVYLLILILGMKPPYLALGLGLLIVYGMWEQVFYSIIFALIAISAVTPILTVKWVASYIGLLQMYSWGNIPDVYAWSITPETMNIFRSAFKGIIGDGPSSLISHIVYYSVYISVVGLSFLEYIKRRPLEQRSNFKVTKGQFFVLLVSSYLLFAPYASGHEDMLLVSVFVMVLLVGDSPKLTNYKSLAILFMLLVILSYHSFLFRKLLCLFWILKVLILGYACYLCGPQQSGKKDIVSSNV